MSEQTRAGRPIVDMRSRPTFLHPFFGGAPGTPEFEVVKWLNRRVGAKDISHFERVTDAAGFVAEMDEAEITVAVMVARNVPGVRVENDALSAVAKTAPDRLIAIASVDPIELGTDAALAEARRAVTELGMKGINLDAGFYKTPLKADDDRLMPFYELCQELDVPAFVMSGPTTPDLAFNDPVAIDHVAKTFPKLPIICCHGFYPRVQEIVTVAFRNENVYVSPDMYTYAPGGSLYVEAANGFMRHQFLFGSSYPFRPMKQGVEDFASLGLDAKAYAAATYKTADRLLKLGLDPTSARRAGDRATRMAWFNGIAVPDAVVDCSAFIASPRSAGLSTGAVALPCSDDPEAVRDGVVVLRYPISACACSGSVRSESRFIKH